MNEQPEVTMSLLPDGTVLHDYGAGSCFSCGGTVLSVANEQGHLHETCATCGVVDYVVFHSDTGEPLQGFMSVAEIRALPVLHDDPDAEIPF